MALDVDLRGIRSEAAGVLLLRELHRLFLDLVELRAWNRVLAVEYGDGWLAEEAWRRMGRGYVCGVDTSPAITESARRLRGVVDELEFKVWDGEKLPFGGGSFDSVLSSFILHRYSRPAMVLREIHRVLKAEGEIYLLEASPHGFPGHLELPGYTRRVDDGRSVPDFPGPTVMRLLEETGFTQASLESRVEGVRGRRRFLPGVLLVRARPAEGL